MGIYNNYKKNNNQNKNINNLMQLMQIEGKNSKDEINNYFPNLNKDLSPFNIYQFAKKKKLSLSQLKFKLCRNSDNNFNKKNKYNYNTKYPLSPTSRNDKFLFIKSESTSNMINKEKNKNINETKINLYNNNNKINLNKFYSNKK